MHKGVYFAMAYLTKEQSERAMHIATRIDLIITRTGMTKAEFAKESGVSTATLSQWRKGTYYPSKSKLDSAAKCLDVSSDYLEFGLKGIKENAPGSDAESEIEKALAQATPAQRELISSILDMNENQLLFVKELVDKAKKLVK